MLTGVMDFSIILAVIIIAVSLILVFILRNRRKNISLPDMDKREKLDARRFAKLLVSEIRLYYPHEVELGRKNCDLYERLTKEIDRAQKIYKNRVGKDNGELSDYFYEELVNTLAEGDPKKLGLSYSRDS